MHVVVLNFQHTNRKSKLLSSTEAHSFRKRMIHSTVQVPYVLVTLCEGCRRVHTAIILFHNVVTLPREMLCEITIMMSMRVNSTPISVRGVARYVLDTAGMCIICIPRAHHVNTPNPTIICEVLFPTLLTRNCPHRRDIQSLTYTLVCVLPSLFYSFVPLLPIKGPHVLLKLPALYRLPLYESQTFASDTTCRVL